MFFIRCSLDFNDGDFNCTTSCAFLHFHLHYAFYEESMCDGSHSFWKDFKGYFSGNDFTMSCNASSVMGMLVARCITVPSRASNNASRSDISLNRQNALLCLAELRRIDIVN